jgi:hypothetical protein
VLDDDYDHFMGYAGDIPCGNFTLLRKIDRWLIYKNDLPIRNGDFPLQCSQKLEADFSHVLGCWMVHSGA